MQEKFQKLIYSEGNKSMVEKKPDTLYNKEHNNKDENEETI